jgi:diguanylate cyclase
MATYDSGKYNDQKAGIKWDIPEKINLSNVLDNHAIQIWLEEFYSRTHFAIAIVDVVGNILVSAGWQEICTKFHRANPATCKNCTASDIHLAQGASFGEFKIYKCLNNLYDAVTPIIVENNVLGNLFFGQFFLDDELIDEEFFKNQAKKYGFNENQYLDALKQVPRFSRSTVKDVMAYFSKLAYMISSVSYKNIQLSRMLAESKILMDSLKVSEEKYRLLVENQTDLIVKTDIYGNYLYASPSYCQLFGQKEEDLLEKPYTPLIYEEDLPVVEKAAEVMLKPPYTCFYEERAKTINGWRWIQWTGRAVIGDHGEINSLIGAGRDITERKYVEEELIASEARHRAMVANILDVIAIIDEYMIVQYVSQNIQKLFGWLPEDLCGQKAWERIHPNDASRNQKMINELLNTDRYIKNENYRYLTKDGSYKEVEVTLTNLLHDPNINGIMVNFHDITKHIKRENEIIYLSYKDVLTGLYNRTFYEEELKRLDNERQLPLSVIMGDVNGLKLINDGFGHAEGDKLLVKIANILKNCCRKNDIICRIGGDEFCILLPQTDCEAVQRICKRIYITCEEGYSKNDEIVNSSISLGYETKIEANEVIENIIKKAEAFMYRHKLLEGRSAHSSLIASIKAAMYEKNQETEKHAERLVFLVEALGQKLGLREEQLNELELLATLHDLGKMSVDQHILNKRGKLTDIEWLEIKNIQKQVTE